MSISAVYAQTKTISGKVIDELNDPLTGVTVRVQGTTTGTITDIDGMYSISTKDGDIIEYSFIGMKTELIAVKGQTSINITLKDGVPFWEKPLLSVMAVPKLKTSHRLLQLLPEMR
ncbi:carboxypeptidase-like regulatory domain-containing protein [Dysgonomonas capnocytophagoides]|uniref:carboxypeptidase-like regulatory domain-containing protein n=1 Tax=Dysgonomonas capnocytophagoides TaxID=45254 RepID=UPI0030C84783